MISIEEMGVMLDEIAEELPHDLYKELNGGIILMPEKKLHKGHKANDLFILGEYHRNGNLGRYIAIYYGSFIKIYGNLSRNRLKERLKKTLKHEFMHHLESLAGERDLEVEDERRFANYFRQHNRKK